MEKKKSLCHLFGQAREDRTKTVIDETMRHSLDEWGGAWAGRWFPGAWKHSGRLSANHILITAAHMKRTTRITDRIRCCSEGTGLIVTPRMLQHLLWHFKVEQRPSCPFILVGDTHQTSRRHKNQCQHMVLAKTVTYFYLDGQTYWDTWEFPVVENHGGSRTFPRGTSRSQVSDWLLFYMAAVVQNQVCVLHDCSWTKKVLGYGGISSFEKYCVLRILPWGMPHQIIQSWNCYFCWTLLRKHVFYTTVYGQM